MSVITEMSELLERITSHDSPAPAKISPLYQEVVYGWSAVQRGLTTAISAVSGLKSALVHTGESGSKSVADVEKQLRTLLKKVEAEGNAAEAAGGQAWKDNASASQDLMNLTRRF